MTKDEALRLALEALENSDDLVRENAYSAEQLYGNYPARQGKVRGLKALVEDHEKAITAIKAALKAKDEPVACSLCSEWEKVCDQHLRYINKLKKKRTWVGLTDEEIKKASLDAGMQEHYMDFHSGFIRFAKVIEAKLRERTHDS